MRSAGSILGIVLAAALGACAHQKTGAETPGQAQAYGTTTPEKIAGTCPMSQLQGVHVTVADVPDGVAITFAAPSGEVDQLRDNVRAMSESNDKLGDAFASCPCGVTSKSLGTAESMPAERGPGAGPPKGARGSTAKPLAESKVQEIPNGAVLKLSPKDPTQLTALRTAARDNASALRKNCLNKAPGAMQRQGK